MKLPAAVAAALLIAMPVLAQNKPEHSKDTIKATSDGNNVGMRGRAVELAGASLKAGDKLPAASLVRTDMSVIDIGSNGGKVRILNIVPSLDTSTCDAQTHELAETNEGLDLHVEMVTISMDLPFAQRRYTTSGEFKKVVFLSDYRGQHFGKGTGLLQKQSQLLARDMQTAFKVARGLI